MMNQVRYDPVLLFRFALRESDWVLADLLARSMRRDERTTNALARELARHSAGSDVPTSFASLRMLARLTRELGVDNGAQD